LVEKSFRRVARGKAIRIVEDAIAGMLPKTKSAKPDVPELNVYAGDRHPHAAQKPVVLAVKRRY